MNIRSTEDFQGSEITLYDTIMMDTINKWVKIAQVTSPKKISDYQQSVEKVLKTTLDITEKQIRSHVERVHQNG